MIHFLVLFREPDGRQQPHDPTFTQQHWQSWLRQYRQQSNLLGGQPLTLNGVVLWSATDPAQAGLHQVGTELVGGYLLLQAIDLPEVETIVRSCPIFEADGYAEIRKLAATS